MAKRLVMGRQIQVHGRCRLALWGWPPGDGDARCLTTSMLVRYLAGTCETSACLIALTLLWFTSTRGE